MRKFIAFFKRIRVFLFFVLLQSCAFSFYITHSNYPKNSFLTSSNFIAGTLYSWEYEITKFFNLNKNNSSLQQENKNLREKSNESLYKVSESTWKIKDTTYSQQYTYILGEIINGTVSNRNNFFTLNIGSLQGVEQFMGVISPEGIVGIIHSVSEHFSVVKSVLSSDINIDVLVVDPSISGQNIDRGRIGLLKWDGKSPNTGNIAGISSDLEIPKGSKVFTRGGAGIFPKGILLGKFINQEVIEGKALLDVEIMYTEDYRTLQRVYVVKNLFRNEQILLEKKVEDYE